MFSSLVLKQVTEVFDISGRRKASQEGTSDLQFSFSWNKTCCVYRCQRFRGTCCLHLPCIKPLHWNWRQ